MIEKPDLSDATIIDGLRDAYGLDVDGLEFLPLGNDATAWVYRVSARGGPDCFLKVKQGEVYPPSLSVPRHLRDQGIPQVVAPLPTRTGALCRPLGRFALILYPFIAGPTGMEAGLTDAQWAVFGQALKRIHAAPLPADLRAGLRHETFCPQWGEMVNRVQARVAQGGFQHPVERALADFWRSRADEIAHLAAHTRALGQQARARSPEPVLCHTDIHTANILVDPAGGLHIVDWDQPLLAPIERDLTFVLSASAGRVAADSREQRAFLSGYGPARADALTLAYYQYEWVVQEIGDYGQRVFFTPGLGDETLQAALQGFRQLWQPGDVVDAAYGSGL